MLATVNDERPTFRIDSLAALKELAEIFGGGVDRLEKKTLRIAVGYIFSENERTNLNDLFSVQNWLLRITVIEKCMASRVESDLCIGRIL